MGHYTFTESVIAHLAAVGFDERDVRRIVDGLFLGPDASEEDVFAVATSVLTEKVRSGSSWPPDYGPLSSVPPSSMPISSMPVSSGPPSSDPASLGPWSSPPSSAPESTDAPDSESSDAPESDPHVTGLGRKPQRSSSPPPGL